MIKVVVVEDNDTIREGLKILIDGTDGFSCVGVYSSYESMIKELELLIPDILLMDIGLPGINGIEGIKQVKTLLPDLTILVLTIYEENDLLFEALCAGASGYLVKMTPPAKFLETIQDAFNGGSSMNAKIAMSIIEKFKSRGDILTSEEKEILSELVAGSNFKAITDSMQISPESLKFHLRDIYKKLHFNSQLSIKIGVPQGKII